MILPAGLPSGSRYLPLLASRMCVLNLGLTPNRADCLSVVGVAREVAAMVGKPLRLPASCLQELGPAIDQQTSVTIEEPELCPRYAARLI